MKAFDYGLYKPSESLLVVIDVQEKLLPVIDGAQTLVQSTNKLISGAGVLGIKTLITEQYPKGIGHTDKTIYIPSECAVLEKTSFSIFGNAQIVDFIAKSGAKNLIICGIESHVCVLASVLHALESGLKVWVAQDALSSRTQANHLNAIELMRSRGANITCVESLLFGAMLESKSKYFKQISALVK